MPAVSCQKGATIDDSSRPAAELPAPPLRGRGSLADIATSRTIAIAKSTAYLAGVSETIQARQRGFDEVVFCDADGSILEGTTLSLVAGCGGQVDFAARQYSTGYHG